MIVLKGFESRGTDISKRILAYGLLLEKTVTDPTKLSTDEGNDLPYDLRENLTIVDRYKDSDDDDGDEDFSKGNEQIEESFFCDIPRKLINVNTGFVYKILVYSRGLLNCNYDNSFSNLYCQL